METLWQDVRYGLRMLGKNPGFTAVAVLTLALGIGVNTALFTVYNGVALKVLPVQDPARIVRFARWFESRAAGDIQLWFSNPEYRYYTEHSRAFSSLIATTNPRRLSALVPARGSSGASQPEFVQGELVSGNYFSTLGMQAALGRTFLPEEGQEQGAYAVAVLSYPFWQRRFAGDARILGKTITVNGTAFTIIGVAPSEFIGTGAPPEVPDLWAPLAMQAAFDPGTDWLNNASAARVQILGRLAPGVTVKQARAEMVVLTSQLGKLFPAKDRTITVTLKPATYFGDTDDPRFQAFVALVMVIVGMVLMIACANLANMLLARAAGRRKEIGVRVALGASRGRLIRLLLTESAMLALLGGAAGLVLCFWTTGILGTATEELIREVWIFNGPSVALRMNPDLRVFIYALVLSLVTGVVSGLAPAVRASRGDLSAALKAEDAAIGPRLARSRLRSILVAGQVAVSLVLLATAGLLLRGLLKAQTANPGYETRNVFVLGLNFGSDVARSNALRQRVIAQLESLNEVMSVAEAARPPMTGTFTPRVMVEDSQADPRSVPPGVLANLVSPSYFQTLGIPITRGRDFTTQESDQGDSVVIVSEATARDFWPGDDPIGRRLKLDMDFSGKFATELQVIGVAKDVRNTHLSRVDPAYLYLPLHFRKLLFGGLLVRTQGDPRSAVAAVRSGLEMVDKGLLAGLWMTSLEQGPLRAERFITQATSIFAAFLAVLALTLAGVGIYGVMAYMVSQRTREIGVRMALGATKGDVLRLMVGQGMIPVWIGGLVGLAGACAVSAVLSMVLKFPGSPDLLFGVSTADPAAYGAASAFLAGIAGVASYIPARRATRVDPMVALRYE